MNVSDAKTVGGHVMTWGNGMFTYATVRGSGHMVPEFRPDAAAVLVDAILARTELPFPSEPPSSSSLPRRVRKL